MNEPSLPPEVRQPTIQEAVHVVGGSGLRFSEDSDFTYFIDVEQRIATDLNGYVHWIQQLGSERLRRDLSLNALRHSVKELTRLLRDAGLGGYACGEAMQICVADLAILEELEDAEVPPNVIRTLRTDLESGSLDLVARLIRNIVKRARVALQPPPTLSDPNVQQLSKLLQMEPSVAPIVRDDRQPILVVATAGRGTRLRTTIPKGLVPVGGIPMVRRVARAAHEAGVQQIVFALRYRADVQTSYLARYGAVLTTGSAEGTGHTAMQALAALPHQRAPVLLSFSDTPFVTRDSFERPLSKLDASGADFVVSTFTTVEGDQSGRILRDAKGDIIGVGQPRLGAEKTPEGDGGVYALHRDPVFEALGRTHNANARYEYGLPDVVQELRASGGRVATAQGNPEEYRGVNQPGDLILARLRASIGFVPPSDRYTDESLQAAVAFFSAYGGDRCAGTSMVRDQMESVGLEIGNRLATYIERASSLVGPILDLREPQQT